jgi:hypothetical protein
MQGSRVETRCFQAMGQLSSTCTAPPRNSGSSALFMPNPEKYDTIGMVRSISWFHVEDMCTASRRAIGLALFTSRYFAVKTQIDDSQYGWSM